ncbi:arginase [Paramyrothecium foliicola]|nr:arginase [Paramyrothecium foliicola]
MAVKTISIIVAPYHVGIYNHRVGGGPLRILSHGLAAELERIAPVSFVNIGPVDEFEGEIGRTFEIMRRISKAVSTAVAKESFPLVLSGNCYASAATVAGLNATVPNLGVLWLDAHDDLDTPSTHENGYLDAMAASMMTGSSWHKLMESVPGHQPTDLQRVVWCGLRDVSDAQRRAVEDAGVDVVWGDAGKRVNFTKELAEILERKSLGHAHVHLDLDVLDESFGRVNEFPSAGGFYPEDLLGLMNMIPKKLNPTSLVVCSFNPLLEGGDTVARLAVTGIRTFVQNLKDEGILVP